MCTWAGVSHWGTDKLSMATPTKKSCSSSEVNSCPLLFIQGWGIWSSYPFMMQFLTLVKTTTLLSSCVYAAGQWCQGHPFTWGHVCMHQANDVKAIFSYEVMCVCTRPKVFRGLPSTHSSLSAALTFFLPPSLMFSESLGRERCVDKDVQSVSLPS